ncbi:MAG: carbohydrate-binding domain-containing protein [Ruminococcaceae bacterium]|nr:carbohydrate-binding domain-containing protein [Oscillospiraceae bacterium]
MKGKILISTIVAGLMLTSVTACSGEDVGLPISSTQSQTDSQTESKTENNSSTDENSNVTESSPETSAPPQDVAPTVDVVAEGMFTDRDMEGTYSGALNIELSDSGIKTTASGVVVDGNTVTIAKEGTYLISGSLSDGQIIVAAGSKDKVQIVLDNASVTKNGGAAIQIKSADKVFITTKENTESTLSSKGNFGVSSDNVDGAIFSKANIVLNGFGTLNVNSETAHGIVTKDNLKIANGTYNITSAKQGLSGKDSVRIAGGNITVTSGTDSIHSENTEDTAKGYVYIAGGNLNLTSGTDAIDASGTMNIKGGSVKVLSGGGSGKKQNSTESYKGLKADGTITVSDGTFTLDCLDDAIHSSMDVNINGGTFEITTSDDAVHSDQNVNISGGTVSAPKCYEGIEGQTITISGGETKVVSSDDGLNAAGGNDGSGMGGGMRPDQFGGGFGGGMMENDSSAGITISGGKLTVVAEGDGIDSNGNVTITGGETYVSGPTNGGNGSLDYGGQAIISGGIFIAAGSNGMAQSFSNGSTQGVIMGNANGSAGDVISIADSSGKTLAEFTTEKNYQVIVISAPGMQANNTYTLKYGEQSQEIEMTSLIYGGSGFGFGGGMGGGGHKPGRHEDLEIFW